MYQMNQDAHDKVVDLHAGLHVAMTALINKKNYAEAELVLRQLDSAFGDLIRGSTAR